MTGWQTLGAVMIAAPFVALFVFAARESGWRVAVGIFVLAAVLIACIAVGQFLRTGAIP